MSWPCFFSAVALPAFAHTTSAPRPAAAEQYQYYHLVGGGTQSHDASLECGQHPKPLTANPAASAAPFEHDRDLRRMLPRERARYEQAQRAPDRQLACERARWEAQHRPARGHP